MSKATYIDVVLDEAISFDGANTFVVRVRNPRMSDYKAARKLAGGDDEATQAFLLASATQLTPEQLDNMLVSDFKRLSEALNSFLG